MARSGERVGGGAVGRRAVLGALGVAATGGVAATAGAQGTDDGGGDPGGEDGAVSVFSVTQGDRCVPVVPLAGHEPVEEFYGLRIPDRYGGENGATDPGEGPYFQSSGTADLQRADVTVTFLYLGPKGLSLVVVHDSGADEDDDGGAVSWTLEGVPAGAEWAVKDDQYRDPETGEQADSNYDAWAVDGDAHTVDWTWGGGGTDGGALRSPTPALDLTVRPAFNDSAALWDDRYAADPIREWHVLSFPDGRGAPERTALALDEPVTIDAGRCEGQTAAGDERDGTVTVGLQLRLGSYSFRRRGAIPVGLKVEEALEASDVVPESLRFGPPDVVEAGGGARPARPGLDDDDRDLVFHFPLAEAGFEIGDTTASLVGRTRDGRAIEGATGVSLPDLDRYRSEGDGGSGGTDSDDRGFLDGVL